jgi:hypothetical protein
MSANIITDETDEKNDLCSSSIDPLINSDLTSFLQEQVGILSFQYLYTYYSILLTILCVSAG